MKFIFPVMILISANVAFASDFGDQPVTAGEVREMESMLRTQISMLNERLGASPAVYSAPDVAVVVPTKMAFAPMKKTCSAKKPCPTEKKKPSEPISLIYGESQKDIASAPKPLWLGSHDPYKGADGTRTVDECGVPIWDDSVNNHYSKDYRDPTLCKSATCVSRRAAAAALDTSKQNRTPDHYNSGPGKVAANAFSDNPDRFWARDVDYEFFEKYSDEELAAKRMAANGIVNGIDTRSCPYPDNSDACREWYAGYHAVDYLARPKLDNRDTETTRQIEMLLQPRKPRGNIWTVETSLWALPPIVRTYDYDFAGAVKEEDCQISLADQIQIMFPGCPFETMAECEIWKRKPHMKETVAPKAKIIRQENVDAIIALVNAGNEIDAKTEIAQPLVRRYQMLMKMSQNCCTEGISHELYRAGASKSLVYKFLVDDANFYQFGDRCLMTTDSDLDNKYSNTATASVVADVRNGCLCRQREWYTALLAPFSQAYAASPEFFNQPFEYTYMDGLQRQRTVSINRDVQAVQNQLAVCP